MVGGGMPDLAVEDGTTPRLMEDDLITMQDQLTVPRNRSRNPSGMRHLGERRNSSFSEFFDGDFGQSLLSRRHFTWGHDEREARVVESEKPQAKDEDFFSVDDPGLFMTKCSDKTQGQEQKRRISKVICKTNTNKKTYLR